MGTRTGGETLWSLYTPSPRDWPSGIQKFPPAGADKYERATPGAAPILWICLREPGQPEYPGSPVLGIGKEAGPVMSTPTPRKIGITASAKAQCPGTGKAIILISLVLMVVPLIPLASLCSCDFVNLDDNFYVSENATVLAGLNRHSFVAAWTGYRPMWHPLTWLSLQANRQLFGAGPAGFHAMNLCLHLVNGVLLFLALRCLSGRLWCSALVAGLFALHPLHVESVAWVSERKGLLSTFFGLISLWAYAGFVRQSSRRAYMISVLAFALSLLAKPMLVMLPALFLLADYWPLGRLQTSAGVNQPSTGRIFLRLCLEKWVFVVVAVLISGIAMFTQRKLGILDALGERPFDVRARYAEFAILQYLGKTLWPDRLILFYQHPWPVYSWRQALGAAGVLMLVTLLAARLARWRPYFLVGWLWYLGAILPVLGLVPLGNYAFADRYTYVPLIGVFVTVVWALADALSRLRRGAVFGTGLAAAAFACCLVTSARQATFWHDSLTLWGHALSVEPDNYVANMQYGAELLEQHRCRDAEPYFRRAIAVCEARGYGSPFPYSDLGDALWLQGKQRAAMQLYERSLELDPSAAHIRHKLGLGWLNQNRPRHAEREFRAALEVEPSWPALRANLGAALFNQRRFREAAAELRTAVRLDPDYATGHNMLGMALEQLGRVSEAVQQYEKAVRLDPNLGAARRNLTAASRKQRQKQAVRHTIPPSRRATEGNDT